MARYDARELGRGWLSVAIAASKDKLNPALSRTVSIERFPEGVRLVATDSYILLHTWVSDVDHPDAPAPDFDEAPYARAVAIDPHGRGKGFLAHALAMANADEDDLVEIDMGLGVVDTEEDDGLTLGGMSARWVILDWPDHERVKLPVYEGEYVNWRPIVLGFQAVTTTAMALSRDIIARLAKLAGVNGEKPIVWHFGGEEKMARLHVHESEPFVEGVCMPVRWNFERNRPWAEVEAEEKEAAAGEAPPDPDEDLSDEDIDAAWDRGEPADVVDTVATEVARQVNAGALGPDVTMSVGGVYKRRAGV